MILLRPMPLTQNTASRQKLRPNFSTIMIIDISISYDTLLIYYRRSGTVMVGSDKLVP